MYFTHHKIYFTVNITQTAPFSPFPRSYIPSPRTAIAIGYTTLYMYCVYICIYEMYYVACCSQKYMLLECLSVIPYSIKSAIDYGKSCRVFLFLFQRSISEAELRGLSRIPNKNSLIVIHKTWHWYAVYYKNTAQGKSHLHICSVFFKVLSLSQMKIASPF